MTDHKRIDDQTAEPEGQGEPPTAREIADLLADHRRMIEAAGGWAHRIPPEKVAAWTARKRDLLARIAVHRNTPDVAEPDRKPDEPAGPGLEWSL
jgi:hypothetical protein